MGIHRWPVNSRFPSQRAGKRVHIICDISTLSESRHAIYDAPALSPTRVGVRDTMCGADGVPVEVALVTWPTPPDLLPTEPFVQHVGATENNWNVSYSWKGIIIIIWPKFCHCNMLCCVHYRIIYNRDISIVYRLWQDAIPWLWKVISGYAQRGRWTIGDIGIYD